MSYHHRVEGPLQGNVLTALRRGGYPITWLMFEDAYNASEDAVTREVKQLSLIHISEPTRLALI
eukprot:8052489-Alexandrium_andersonii.AAC.1